LAIHELTLRALMEDLDGGRISEAFMTELRRVALDCDDRPADDKARKVTLELQITPVCDEHGCLDTVRGKFHVKSTVPQRRSRSYDFAYRAGGQLVFNDMSDDNFRQQTFE